MADEFTCPHCGHFRKTLVASPTHDWICTFCLSGCARKGESVTITIRDAQTQTLKEHTLETQTAATAEQAADDTGQFPMFTDELWDPDTI